MKTVLIIEDNEDIREGTAEILELADYKVLKAENGIKGVEAAQKYFPDIILCDIMMPELDGYGVLYMLGKNQKTADIPFIFLTAKAEKTDIRKGMGMGADDYLTKPFDDIELLNAIEIRLKKNERIKGSGGKKRAGEISPAITDADEMLTELSIKSRIKLFKKKQNVYSEGDHAGSVFLIKSGVVKTFMIYADGRKITTGIFTSGEFLGYGSVLLNRPFSEYAETLEDTELHIISKDEFNRVVFENALLSKRFIELLSVNMQDKMTQLMKVAYGSVRKRVADTLVDLGMKFGNPGNDSAKIKISRDDLASLVGTASETISRTLADFRDEGLIEKETGAVIIKSLAKLKAVKQ